MAEQGMSSSSTELFRGQYRFRTIHGTLAVIIPLSFGAVFGTIGANLIVREDQSLAKFVGGGFVISALFLESFGLYALFAWVADKRIAIAVAEEGITFGARFKPWDQIRELYGTRYSNGICLGYTPVGKWFYVEKSLETTPLLSEQEYIALAQELCVKITHRYPKLKIAMLPVEDNT